MVHQPPKHLLEKLPDAGLHPQLGVLSVQELEAERQWLSILSFRRRAEEERLEMEVRGLVISRDLNRKDTVARSKVGDGRRVTTSDGDLDAR
jgi:hypothetical protein